MSGWIIAAALGSVAVTALLTFVLWRMNAPLRARDDDGGGDAADGTTGEGANSGGAT